MISNYKYKCPPRGGGEPAYPDVRCTNLELLCWGTFTKYPIFYTHMSPKDPIFIIMVYCHLNTMACMHKSIRPGPKLDVV